MICYTRKEPTAMHLSNKKRVLLQYGLLLASVLMIAYGVTRDEIETVWSKAINICLECIGLG